MVPSPPGPAGRRPPHMTVEFFHHLPPPLPLPTPTLRPAPHYFHSPFPPPPPVPPLMEGKEEREGKSQSVSSSTVAPPKRWLGFSPPWRDFHEEEGRMNEPLRKNLLKDQVGEKKLQRGKSADVCNKERKTEIKVLGRKLPPSQRGERENRGIPRLEGRRKEGAWEDPGF